MAVDVNIPVALVESAAEYISRYGAGTATVYLTYGTASPPAAGTASQVITSGTDRYDFWVTTPVGSYFQWTVGNGTDVAYTSSIFQAPQGYCTLEEVVQGLDLPDTSRYDEIQALILEATDHITNVVCGGRSFFRDPVGSGTTTKTLNITVPYQNKLSLARWARLDIISLTTVNVGDYTGASYTAVASGSTGYYLTPDVPQSGHPYSDLILSDVGTNFTYFPKGYGTVQLVGAFGWPAVPSLVRRATVDLVRAWWESRGRDGEPVGMSAFGAPIFSAYPRSVRDLAKSDYAWKDWVA